MPVISAIKTKYAELVDLRKRFAPILSAVSTTATIGLFVVATAMILATSYLVAFEWFMVFVRWLLTFLRWASGILAALSLVRLTLGLLMFSVGQGSDNSRLTWESLKWSSSVLYASAYTGLSLISVLLQEGLAGEGVMDLYTTQLALYLMFGLLAVAHWFLARENRSKRTRASEAASSGALDDNTQPSS